MIKSASQQLRSPTGVWGKETGLRGQEPAQSTIPDDTCISQEDAKIVINISGVHTEPILLEHEGKDSLIELEIVTEENAEAIIIEKVSGKTIHNVNARLAANSRVDYAVIQEGTYESKKSAVVARDATMTWFEVNSGRANSRTHTILNENASVLSSSIYFGDKELIDYGSTAEHEGEYSESKLFTKGILRHAPAIYDGVLSITKSAKHAIAHQREDCLLLTPDSEIKAAPRLYIDNNDVVCSHAVTTTKPDEELGFYLQSRGVSETEARSLLVRAFVWPVVESLPNHFACKVEHLVEEALEKFQDDAFKGDAHE